MSGAFDDKKLNMIWDLQLSFRDRKLTVRNWKMNKVYRSFDIWFEEEDAIKQQNSGIDRNCVRRFTKSNGWDDKDE